MGNHLIARGLRHRFLKPVVLSFFSFGVAAVLFLGPVGSETARADHWTPSGCVYNSYAPYYWPEVYPHTMPNWRYYCYCGTDDSKYVRDANLVLGIQRLLSQLGIGVGPLDGIFGPQTKSGVMFFQDLMNLSSVDGIVGRYTYDALSYCCVYYFTLWGYDYHRPHIPGYAGYGSPCFRHVISNNYWQIWNLAGGWYNYFNAFGPS